MTSNATVGSNHHYGYASWGRGGIILKGPSNKQNGLLISAAKSWPYEDGKCNPKGMSLARSESGKSGYVGNVMRQLVLHGQGRAGAELKGPTYRPNRMEGIPRCSAGKDN
jgi:hypothetical protein